MAKGTVKSNEEYLRSVGLPEQTETYTVISHGDIIDKVNEQLTANGFTITESRYYHMADGEIAKGELFLECDKDPDMGMLFTWWNSYNKRVRFGCAIGAFIHDNKSTMIGTEGLSWARKHTGTSDDEAWSVITQLIENGNEYFDKVITEKEKMQAMPLSLEDFGCIMGALYFEHDLITPTQASATKQAYKDNDTNNCLWDLYKHLMFGLDGMDLTKWAKSQQKLHHMIMSEYLIIQEDKEELEGPGLEEEPFIGETQEVTAEELAAKWGVEIPAVQMSEDQIELIKEEHGVQDAPAFEIDPEASIEKSIQEQFMLTAMSAGYAEALCDYYIKNHLDESISLEDNIQGFCDWAPEKSDDGVNQAEYDAHIEAQEEVQSVGLSGGEKESSEDFVFPTDLDDSDKLVPSTVEEFENIIEEDLELEDAIDLAEDDFEAQLAAAFEDNSETEEEEKEKKPSIKPVENITEPVQILPPKEPKKAEVKSLKKEEKKNPGGMKEEEDFLDVTAHEGLEVPAELIAEASIIEKKMGELYGLVKPYQINKTDDHIFITIDETHESFCLAIE